MADIGIKSKHDEEVESLAMNLKRNKLASSDSEARRMAQEMLSTGKKVQDDFAAREKKIYGTQVKNPEVELAHRQVEQLTNNISRGKSNVRIDIPELDLNKPLKDIVGVDDDYVEKEDDEIIEMKEDSASESSDETPDEEQGKSVDEPSDEVAEEPAEEAGEAAEDAAEPEEEPKTDEEAAKDDEDDDDSGDIGPGDAPNQPVEVEKTADDGDEDDGGDGDDDSGEGGDDDKPDGDAPFEAEAKASPDECADESSDGEPDFSVKELNGSEQLKKSEDDRKAEISKMEESRINLANMFNVNK